MRLNSSLSLSAPALAFALLSLSISSAARAQDGAASSSESSGWQVGRPMIETVAGMEYATDEEVNVLLRVGFEGIPLFNDENESYVIAKFRGVMSVDPRAGLSGAERLPYVDLEFVSFTCRRGEGLQGGEWRFLPGRIGRNIRLNQELTVRVNVIGIQKNFMKPLPIAHGRFIAYASLAADALGIKMASYVTDQNRFFGVSAVAAAAEAGVVVRATDNLKVRIAAGASGDINLGTNVGDGAFTLQSDTSAYAEVSLDVRRFFRFFIRNGVNNNDDNHASSRTEYQLMVGATFIF